MRIVQAIDLLKFGGAQKLLVTFAEAVRDRDVDLTVIAFRDDPETPIPGELRACGAKVLVFPSKSLFDPRPLWQLTSFLRRERPDVVHAHLTYATIIGAFAGRLAGVPLVASIHNTEADADYPIRQPLETWALYSGARRVIAVGHVVAEANRSRLRDKPIDVIVNAVAAIPPISETERIAIRTAIAGDPARPLLISVGRLTEQKGYADLLRAFADLRQSHPSAALAIAGRGHLQAELTAQIAALGLQGHAHLLGPRSDVPQLLAASDIFVSSSYWEGLPVAVLEAMAAGLPIVATQVGDVPHVVVEGTGALVPPRQPRELATALRSLLDQPARIRAFGTAARTHVERFYGSAAWADQLLALYKDAQRPSTPTNVLPDRQITSR